MNGRTWRIAAALCLVASAGACKQSSGHDPAPAGPTVTLTPSATSVVANGTNTVTFSVTDTGAAAVTVTTDRGTLNGGVASYVIPAGTGATNGTVTLTTCNSGTNVGCAGVAAVRATSTSGAATASINFTSLAAACQTNCGADAGCAGLACTLTAGGAGSCSATSPSACTSAPACTPSASTETSCSGGVDEDCNGKIDCADSACDGQRCGASATDICVAGACTDVASGLGVTISSDRARLPANDSTVATITVQVLSGTDPAASQDVTISTTHGTLSAATGTTDAAGNATFTLRAATPGVAVITAASALVPEIKASTTITIPRLGSIQIPTNFATNPVMGVQTSGWNEMSGIAVQVLDDQGQPYPDGLVVRFQHQKLGGSTFGAPTVTCAPTPCSAYDASIFGGADKVDTTGLATAPLFSGTLAGTLAVTASATAGGDTGNVTRTATLPGIAVVGAKASLANFSIQCSPRNVPALAETDCATSWVDAQITCAALLKDRFNNLLGTATQVIFVSEAGAVGQVASTPAYDPASGGAGQKDLGTATQIFQTLGAGLPFDVPPLMDGVVQIEKSVDHGLDGCGPRTHNPRDGVVTIVAIADGEEAFFDANGNGKYDAAGPTTPGEPFIDQGEPFVDQNDNGQWDPGEWFLDVDGNGAYTGPNGKWDANAKIWTQTVVVYTGDAVTLDATATTFLGTRWVDGFGVNAFTGSCNASPAPTPFSVKAKITGPPEIPATYEPYFVVASDLNLNMLATGATYAVEMEPGPSITATYHGLDKYADELGLAYQYWPCDQAATPSCASQCRAAVPPTGGGAGTGPCLMKPAITTFGCGVAAGVRVTGGDKAESGCVDWNVDTPWDVYGSSKVAVAKRVLCGAAN